MQSRFSAILTAIAILVSLFSVAGQAGAISGDYAQPDNGPPTMVSYQGRITIGKTSYNGTGYFKFAIVNADGTTSYWSNDGTSSTGDEPTNGTPLTVTGGLFNVLLGDPGLTNMTQTLDASVFNNTDRYLRVWFSEDNINFQQLSPDRRIAAVPYALQAINADTLDGEHASAFADASHTHAPTDISPQGAGSNLDADTLDGQHADQLVPPGTVVAFAGGTPPDGWLLCDGSVVSRTLYADLFAAIGTAHGYGDGSTTFHLPDYRGYFLRGVDMGTGRDPDAASRGYPNTGGNNGDAVGSVQNDQMQAHKHQDYGHQHQYTSQTHNDTDNIERNGAHAANDSWSNYYTSVGYANLSNPIASSAGTPRYGWETRPKNASVNWIIKY